MALTEYRNYVAGRFVGTTRQFDDVDPATGRVRATVHEAGDSLVAEAVDAARRLTGLREQEEGREWSFLRRAPESLDVLRR